VNTQTTGRPLEILLVDDNPGDVRLTMEALKDGKLQSTVHAVQDGVEALAFLHRGGKYAGVPRPDLILLDLNLPRMNGAQVLADIKEDTALKHIPVVVLSGSRDMDDIVKAYNLRANCYVTKPIDLEEFMVVVKAVSDFWLTIAQLPIGEV
jgi:chemotaxis family two-component system response regulator Rcp1